MTKQEESWTGHMIAVVVNRFLALAIGIILLIVLFGKSAESVEHLRSYRDGDVMIGMTLPMHTAATENDVCSAVSVKSIFVLEAMLYTIRRKNRVGRDMNGMQIGYDVRDTCFSISTAMKQGLNFVANIEEWKTAHDNASGEISGVGFGASTKPAKPGSGFPIGNDSGINKTMLCHEKPIMGLVGASGSSVSIAIAGLFSLYRIPMISYFSTSTALSDTHTYPSFYRTIPSDDKQTVAMAEMITRFHWNYISTIATDNEYGREASHLHKVLAGIEALKGEIAYRNICLARDDLYDPTAGDQQVVNIISALKEDARVKVIILFMYWQHAKLFLNEAYRQGLKGITWIASESWSATHEMLQLPPELARGIIGISVPSHVYPDFQNYVHRQPLYRRVRHNPWLSVYAKENFNCNLMESSTDCPQTKYDSSLKDCPQNWTLGDLLETNETLSVTVNAANALLTLVEAMNMAIADKKDDLIKDKWFTHEELNRYVGRVDFKGAGEEHVRFDENGDFVGAKYHILNVQEKNGKLGLKTVGEWESGEGPGTLTLREEEIQWNEGTRPVSRCSAVCQPGYQMLPSPSECCWDCQKCPVGEISNSTQSLLCHKCELYTHTNQKQSECLPNKETWLYHYLPMCVAILTMGLLGLLSVLIILVIIIVFRDLVVIRRTELKYTFLLVTFSGHLYPFFHALMPTTARCTVQLCLLFIPSVLQTVILMSQTEPVLVITGRALHLVFHKRTYKKFVQIFTFYLLGIIGIALCLLPLAISLPIVKKSLEKVSVTFLSCEDPYRDVGFVPIIFSAILLMIAAFFFEREKPGLRHSSYNGISCYVLVLILAVTIPVYVTVSYEQPKILILTLGNSLAHFAITGLKFLPQMYDIFVKKDRTKQDVEITLDTDTSQMSQPDAAQKERDAATAQPDADSSLQVPRSPVKTDNIPMSKIQSRESQKEAEDSDDIPRDPADVTLQVPEIIVDHDENRSNGDCDTVDIVRDSRESLRGSDLHINESPNGGHSDRVPVLTLKSYDDEENKNEVIFV
ncbi:metabotropic glutamate receptor 3-like isoform X2 [Lineus longissimus]|uniref:metabotropic glutamate receptor 3-like isoform X2 n=1 Tax=Lineus longissimus TaxID=88925 RepID=UPI00315DB2C5